MYLHFDKVTLLYEGRQIYFGEVESAMRYFDELGFENPTRATIADFLTSVTNPVERIIREGYKQELLGRLMTPPLHGKEVKSQRGS
ncbi:hypothetical protein RRF57_008510 [Xylaria bambusicola]|uniref:Uncharacterized protein n=1 Tax=Xylaria bambusicola TaxID=326684 RepID=A0AAN7ZB12_9PEZI